MISKSYDALLEGVLVLVVFGAALCGCSCRPEPIPEESTVIKKSVQAEPKSKLPEPAADAKVEEGKEDSAQGDISEGKEESSDGSGSGNSRSGKESGEPKSPSGQGANPVGSSESSDGVPGAFGAKSANGSKGRKSRFSVGTVLNEDAAEEMSKGTTLSPEELKAKATDAMDKARQMVKEKEWAQGYESASECYVFLTSLPAESQNAEVKVMQEECMRLLKNCSSHLDPGLSTGNDKVIVIE